MHFFAESLLARLVLHIWQKEMRYRVKMNAKQPTQIKNSTHFNFVSLYVHNCAVRRLPIQARVTKCTSKAKAKAITTQLKFSSPAVGISIDATRPITNTLPTDYKKHNRDRHFTSKQRQYKSL